MIALLQSTQSAAESRVVLWGGIGLADPYFLLLIPVAVAFFFLGWRMSRREHVRVPRLDREAPPRSWAQMLAWLPLVMKVLAVMLTIIGLSRPLKGTSRTSSEGEGVDIALVFDRSSSMEERIRPERTAPTRLAVAKDVVGAFAERRMTDTEGVADNVALIVFAGYADLICPFTLDHGALRGRLAAVRTAHEPFDGTSIGLAVLKTVALFQELEAQSKVGILLSDGENNNEQVPPLAAAKAAAEEGVKFYSVFVGPLDTYGRLGRVRRDTRELRQLAEITGGKFFHARTAEDLEEVYEEIENLERRFREEEVFSEHFDLYPRFLVPAAILYALAWLSMWTWARRLP